MDRRNRRIIEKLDNFLDTQKKEIITNGAKNLEGIFLYSRDVNGVKKHGYDPDNKLILFNYLYKEDVDFVIDELEYMWKQIIRKAIIDFYGKTNGPKMAIEIHKKNHEVRHMMNYYMCCIVLEGTFGLDKKKIMELVKPSHGITNFYTHAIAIVKSLNETPEKFIVEMPVKKNIFAKILAWFKKVVLLCRKK